MVTTYQMRAWDRYQATVQRKARTVQRIAVCRDALSKRQPRQAELFAVANADVTGLAPGKDE